MHLTTSTRRKTWNQKTSAWTKQSTRLRTEHSAKLLSTMPSYWCLPEKKMNNKARLITGTGKHERGLSQLLRDDLHWLDVQRRVQFKLAVTVHLCLHHRAPSYLIDYCVPVSEVSGRQHLRSASRCQLTIPRVHRSTIGARAFAVAGPTVWNSLPYSLRDPAVGQISLWPEDIPLYPILWFICSALEMFHIMRYTNLRLLTYLLTTIVSPCFF